MSDNLRTEEPRKLKTSDVLSCLYLSGQSYNNNSGDLVSIQPHSHKSGSLHMHIKAWEKQGWYISVKLSPGCFRLLLLHTPSPSPTPNPTPNPSPKQERELGGIVTGSVVLM